MVAAVYIYIFVYKSGYIWLLSHPRRHDYIRFLWKRKCISLTTLREATYLGKFTVQGTYFIWAVATTSTSPVCSILVGYMDSFIHNFGTWFIAGLLLVYCYPVKWFGCTIPSVWIVALILYCMNTPVGTQDATTLGCWLGLRGKFLVNQTSSSCYPGRHTSTSSTYLQSYFAQWVRVCITCEIWIRAPQNPPMADLNFDTRK